MVRATSKTKWIGAALLLHAPGPVLKHVGLNPHLHMSAFLLLLWPRCQWVLCWLLSKQENYSTFPPISWLVFLSVPKKFWEGVPSHFTPNDLPVVIVCCSLWSHIRALPLSSLCSSHWHPQMYQAHAPVMPLLPSPPGTLFPCHICPSPFCRDMLTCPFEMKPLLTD